MTVYTKKQEETSVILAIVGICMFIAIFVIPVFAFLFLFTGIAFFIPIINIFITQTRDESNINPPLTIVEKPKRRR